MWSDNETALDLVGFRVHADLIRAIVTDSTLLPVTVGLFGDWGGGKSSIMKMIERDLDPDSYQTPEEKKRYEHVACLYFNGWLFEGYDDAKAAIISTILKELMEHRRFGAKVKDKAKSLLKSVDWMRAAKTGLTKVVIPAAVAYATGGTSLLPEIGKAASGLFKDTKPEKKEDTGKEDDEEAEGKETEDEDESEEDDSPLKGIIRKTAKAADPKDVRTFRKRFSELLAAGNIETLVVLIDDLDRCSPERIVENLEAIKLFLNVERTAFIIGADPRIVRHAVVSHYTKNSGSSSGVSDAEEQSQLVRDYLEKVIQIPYHLPRLSPSETETYMSLLFCQREIKEKEQLDKVLQACEEQRAANRYRSFGYSAIKEVFADRQLPGLLSSSLSFTVGAAPLITEGLKGNPRQVKRFLNAYILRKKLAEVAKIQHIRDDVMVKLMILEYAHPNEFKELYDWQAKQDGHPYQLKDWEGEENQEQSQTLGTAAGSKKPDNWATPSMQKWLTMEPELASVDLGDYFWLARDKMASTLSGMSLVAPFLRTLLEALLSDVSGKRKEAAREAAGLTEEDRVALLSLLERHILSTPNDATGYDALHELIDNSVAGACETLVRVLSNADAAKIPPGEAFRLTSLLQRNTGLSGLLGKVVESHERSNTPFGIALRESKTPRSAGGTR